ncbi:MAG: glycosyltransferase family 2 protein [Dysgonamonadaceae bacterium]|jgi:GT2 family glycosyltransferase|nr:glycosyltransferase family 2 protein [Dysgonamonadaceae bacterium]
MKISIIIVNYNVKFFLEQCLDSVMRASRKVESEIYVIDNASSDQSVEYLEPKFPSVHFIANQENIGFSKANNQAIHLAKGHYILLLNPDTIIGEDSLQRLCAFMDEHPEAGAAGVRMIDGSGHFLPESKRGFPSPWASFCKMSGLARLFPQSRLFGKYHLRYLSEYQINEVDVLAGAFMIIRKEALNQTGLLDETFFMYGEDIDLSYRIKQSGYKNYYVPETIIHYKGESTQKDFKYVKHFYQAMLIFYDKHYPESYCVYHWGIHFAVKMKACLSAIDKFFRQNKRQNHTEEPFFLNDNRSYEEIIASLDANKKKS